MWGGSRGWGGGEVTPALLTCHNATEHLVGKVSEDKDPREPHGQQQQRVGAEGDQLQHEAGRGELGERIPQQPELRSPSSPAESPAVHLLLPKKCLLRTPGVPQLSPLGVSGCQRCQRSHQRPQCCPGDHAVAGGAACKARDAQMGQGALQAPKSSRRRAVGGFRKETKCREHPHHPQTALWAFLAPELCQPTPLPAAHFSAVLPTPGCPIPPALGSPGCPAHLCAAREEGRTPSISS